jgi:hypothetical protein
MAEKFFKRQLLKKQNKRVSKAIFPKQPAMPSESVF